MKIIVLSGSPKGELSITLQYVIFIQKKFPQHQFEIIHVSEKINQIEKDEKLFQEIIDKVKSSQGILWAFPLYYFLVPSQYKRFIELIWERDGQEVFRDKYAAVLTTSIHFFDHAAHNYMNGICDDLKMKYAGFFSAASTDLLNEEQREKIYLFAESFLKRLEKNISTATTYDRLHHSTFVYIAGKPFGAIDNVGKKILIVTDASDNQINLVNMIERFKKSFLEKIEVINLNSIDIKGGCLGCIHCGYDNVCVYQDKDGYADFYNNKLRQSDIIIFAGAIKDRYLSSRWKLFFDRSFFYTHIPSLAEKQIGFIISGPLRQLPNLRQILEAYVECMQANSAGFVTDEYENAGQIDFLLQDLAEQLIRYDNKKYARPHTFLSIGGRKILRDEIWGELRFVLQADDRYYKRHGMYDFPHRNIKARIFNVSMILLTKNSYIRNWFIKNIKENIIKPYKKVIENI